MAQETVTGHFLPKDKAPLFPSLSERKTTKSLL